GGPRRRAPTRRDGCTSRAATLESPSFRRFKEGNRTMERSSPLIAGVGLADRARKSRWPARLDLTQSATGLVLVLFMWGHMFFVSSILNSKDAMWTITKFFEGYFFFGTSYAWIVSIVVAVVIGLIVVHAALALRKFPSDYHKFRTFRGH